jgi:hypothetical protein
MPHRGSWGCALIALTVATGGARAADEKYPNWKGQWFTVRTNFGENMLPFDPTKPVGPAQQAPLTPEYEKVLHDSMADQAKGGLGNFAGHSQCLPGGMPTMMTTQPQEYVITPHTTYILLGGADHYRRIFTDGRDFPAGLEPSYQGYSIGRWIDEDGSGRYDLLEVETRGPFKGPRAYDATGLPLAFDNQSVFKERFHLDKKNPNLLHDEITVFDNALTRPLSVDKTFRRSSNPRPDWPEVYCVEGNDQVVIGTENYIVNGEGLLMPAKKDQAPPDLRYFKQTSK